MVIGAAHDGTLVMLSTSHHAVSRSWSRHGHSRRQVGFSTGTSRRHSAMVLGFLCPFLGGFGFGLLLVVLALK